MFKTSQQVSSNYENLLWQLFGANLTTMLPVWRKNCQNMVTCDLVLRLCQDKFNSVNEELIKWMVQEINYFKFKNFDDDTMRWRICGCMDACMWFLCRRKGHVNMDADLWHIGATLIELAAWYVSSVSIIFDVPCLFLHHLLSVLLHFVAFLCIFRD
jgi:hypothetical protein